MQSLATKILKIANFSSETLQRIVLCANFYSKEERLSFLKFLPLTVKMADDNEVKFSERAMKK